MHCDDENDDDNGDDDDDCNGDDNCDDDDDDGLNLHRGSACSSLNKTTQSRKEESHLLIAVCKPIQNTKKCLFTSISLFSHSLGPSQFCISCSV